MWLLALLRQLQEMARLHTRYLTYWITEIDDEHTFLCELSEFKGYFVIKHSEVRKDNKHKFIQVLFYGIFTQVC